MRKNLYILSGILLLSSTGFGETAKELYDEAVVLYNKGEITEAVAKLKRASELSPNTSAYKNAYIKLSRNEKEIVYKLKVNQLNKIVIPQVDFQDETVSNALKKLTVAIETFNEENKTTYNSNFVIKSSELADKKITLSIKNVPLKVVLENINLLSNSTYKVEDYLISFSSR